MKGLLKITGFAFIFATLAFASQPLNAQTAKGTAESKGMEFHHGTFEEALAAAKKENKLVFVDAYAVWCGPCKMMSYQTFPNEQVGTYFNEHFVNVKMDMEKGEGRKYAREWGIRGYPTLIVFDASGKQVYRLAGGLRVADFMKFGKAGVKRATEASAANPASGAH